MCIYETISWVKIKLACPIYTLAWKVIRRSESFGKLCTPYILRNQLIGKIAPENTMEYRCKNGKSIAPVKRDFEKIVNTIAVKFFPLSILPIFTQK